METDEAIMDRYFADEEISSDEPAAALKNAVVSLELFLVTCGVSTKNLGTTGLLDLLAEGIPRRPRSPWPWTSTAVGRPHSASRRSPILAGRINLFRVPSRKLSADSTLVNSRTEQGARRPAAHPPGEGSRAGARVR